jgi:hypothetical protein
MSASRRSSRATTAAAGSGATNASGIGCTQPTSAPAGTAGAYGSSDGPPRPDGSTRRPRRSSAVRQAFVAIWCSHVRTDDRPSNPP